MNHLLSAKDDIYSGDSYEDQLQDLVYRGTADDIEDILAGSPNTRETIGLIDDAKIYITVLWLDSAYAHERDDVYESISNAWNQSGEYYNSIDAKKTYVAAALAEAFASNGMQVPIEICDGIVSKLADMVISDYGLSILTIEQVESFFNSYS